MAARSCLCCMMATSSPSRTSTSKGLGCSLIPSSGAPSSLSVRAAAPQPKWDPADCGLHHVVRGTPRDRTSLRALEVLLRHLLGQEKRRIDAPDRMCWSPSSLAWGPGVPGHRHHEVQQRVALVVVLHQELRCRPSPALHRPYDCGSSAGVVVGACRQGKEEACPAPWCHRVPEGPWPLRRCSHRGLSFKVGGTDDGACASAVEDGIGSAARGHGTCLGSLPNSEIQQHIQEALKEPDATFPVEGHPAMRPDTGFIDLVSTSRPPHCVCSFS
jgi:hypothetical protein